MAAEPSTSAATGAYQARASMRGPVAVEAPAWRWSPWNWSHWPPSAKALLGSRRADVRAAPPAARRRRVRRVMGRSPVGGVARIVRREHERGVGGGFTD